jgi:hypothetical protein
VKSSYGSDSSLLPVWIVGFTGHRHLQAPEKVAESLRKVIDYLRAGIAGQLMGYSSVAIGADTLFAEACVSLSIPWTAVLPRPENDFKSDFNESDWQRTSWLLRQAAHIESLSPRRDRELAYLECGLSTVEEADLMIAVWDGNSSRGTGGTADVVAHARTLAKPLILLNPHSLHVERERFSLEQFSDKEMSYLNRVPDYAPHESPGQPQERVRQFFEKVDRHAARIAPRVRGWVGASVLMNALAAILTTASIVFVLTSKIVDAIIFLLVAGAIVSVALIKRKEAHRKWIRCRVAAEICRSALATWRLGDFATPFWFTQLDGFTRLAKSVRLLHLSDREKRLFNLDDWRQNYLESRVDAQLNYFRRRRRKLTLALAIFNGGFWTLSALAIGRTIFSALFLRDGSGLLLSQAIHSFLPIALPLAAGCALSLISIFDLNRQLARSKAMETLLKTARGRIEKCETIVSLRHAVEHAENAFASEVFEWFILYKYPRFS